MIDDFWMESVLCNKKINLTNIEMFYAKQLPLQNKNTIYIFLSNVSKT